MAKSSLCCLCRSLAVACDLVKCNKVVVSHRAISNVIARIHWLAPGHLPGSCCSRGQALAVPTAAPEGGLPLALQVVHHTDCGAMHAAKNHHILTDLTASRMPFPM